MKIEKKIVALCICALTIGIAAILPIAYLMPASTAAKTNPWFNVDILYANTYPDALIDGERVNVSANFTLTPDGVNLNGADAKIEVFNVHLYSDQGSIANLTYSLALSGDVTDPNSKRGYSSAISGWSSDSWTFADGSKYDLSDVIGYTEGSSGTWFTSLENNPWIDMGYFVSGISTTLTANMGERSAQAQIELRNTQTLYIDVTRVMTITYQHQSKADSTVSSITTTLINSEVLNHIELSKTDYGFTYGPVPDTMLPPSMAKPRPTGEPIEVIMW